MLPRRPGLLGHGVSQPEVTFDAFGLVTHPAGERVNRQRHRSSHDRVGIELLAFFGGQVLGGIGDGIDLGGTDVMRPSATAAPTLVNPAAVRARSASRRAVKPRTPEPSPNNTPTASSP
jgi:hypothetical protein